MSIRKSRARAGCRRINRSMRSPPPVCLFYGDCDHHSPLGSVGLYRKLYEMKIPRELPIDQGVPRAFGIHSPQPNLQSWEESRYLWLQSIGMDEGEFFFSAQ